MRPRGDWWTRCGLASAACTCRIQRVSAAGARRMDRHIIVGMHVTDLPENAAPVQVVLTEHGGYIKMRLGSPDANGGRGR